MPNTTFTNAPVKGTWNVQKSKLKEKFSILSDEDLKYENGKRDEMLSRVRIKIGMTKEEFTLLLSSL